MTNEEDSAHIALSTVLIPDLMPDLKFGPEFLREDNIMHHAYHCHSDSDYDTSLLELLIGFKGSYTADHTDFMGVDGWLLCISGAKLWMCVPPTSAAAFDAMFGSRVMTSHMTIAAREQLVKMDALAFIQTAGDVVVMPSGWQHWVCNIEDSVAIGGAHLRLSGLKHLNEHIIREKTPNDNHDENIKKLNSDLHAVDMQGIINTVRKREKGAEMQSITKAILTNMGQLGKKSKLTK